MDVAPGAVWLRGRLSPDEQVAIASRALALLNGPAGGYVPTVRGGGRMRVRMTALGRHWNARTYRYVATREDHDGLPAPPVPDDWVTLGAQLGSEAGFRFTPDICIVNEYGTDGRMGAHQDKDEGRASLEAGLPVVSLSLGATARFLWGGLTRKDPVETFLLASGDVFVFGGPARLRFHGVSRILPDTAPPGFPFDGRINLTFRCY